LKSKLSLGSNEHNGERLTPGQQVEEAFKEYECHEASHRLKDTNRQKVLKETKMQLASAYSKAMHSPPLVWEGPQSFVVYAKLHFDKPTYRKLMYLSELYDEPFVKTITEMIEHELAGELNNTAELGDRIKRRILEEAHLLGEDFPTARPKALQEAGEEISPS
jgi:hypothetical protein